MPKQLAYVDSKGRPVWGIAIQLAFGLLAFIGESGKQGIVFNWLLALSGLSFFFTWAAICLAHIRFRHAWKLQGHVKAELPYEAIFGVWGGWYGLVLNCLCMIATFYVALFVSSPFPLFLSPQHQKKRRKKRKKLSLTYALTAHRRFPRRPSLLLILSRRPTHHRPLLRLENLRARLAALDSERGYGYHVWQAEFGVRSG